MKTFSSLALGLVIALGFVPQLSAAPQFGTRDRGSRDRVCVYQDIHYQGWEQCYNAGDEISSLDRRNNAVSSIRIYGRARVTVYEDTEFRGRSAEFTSDVPDLGLRNLAGSKSWSDHIQSLRVAPDSYGNNGGGNSRNAPIFGRPEPQQVNEGICVYDRPDYQGREQCWNAGQDLGDLARAGNWSDRISSIRVFGGAEAVLYRDIDFRGENIVIDRDTPNLSQVSARSFRNWDRQTSSIVVEGRNNRGRGRARGRFWR
jgi:hypothetical protein